MDAVGGDPLDRRAGGVSPKLREMIDERVFSMPVEAREAFDEALEFDAALEEDEWPYDDDPPDPL